MKPIMQDSRSAKVSNLCRSAGKVKIDSLKPGNVNGNRKMDKKDHKFHRIKRMTRTSLNNMPSLKNKP